MAFEEVMCGTISWAVKKRTDGRYWSWRYFSRTSKRDEENTLVLTSWFYFKKWKQFFLKNSEERSTEQRRDDFMLVSSESTSSSDGVCVQCSVYTLAVLQRSRIERANIDEAGHGSILTAPRLEYKQGLMLPTSANLLTSDEGAFSSGATR